MKTIIIILCTALGSVIAQPAIGLDGIFRTFGNVAGQAAGAVRDVTAEIIQDERVQDLGGYFYRFLTNNDIYQEARGQLVPQTPTSDEYLKVDGAYGWRDRTGNVYANTYEADENGLSKSSFRLLGVDCLASLCGTQLG